jgi:hypothetical protein
MAAAGTLISELETQSGGGDGDLVQQILADMSVPNTSGAPTRPPIPQAMPALPMQGMPPIAPSMAGMTMDSQIPTSHMIGNQHPTPADFAAAMNGMQGANTLMGAPVLKEMPGTTQQVYEAPTKNMYGKILDEVKVPFVVSILFFIFSLPPIRVLVAHYLPSLIKPTGEFRITGLLVVSLIVGLVFWLLQRVIAPLLSL